MIDKLLTKFSEFQTSLPNSPSNTHTSTPLEINASPLTKSIFNFKSKEDNIFNNQYDKVYQSRFKNMKSFYSNFLKTRPIHQITEIFNLTEGPKHLVCLFGIINRKIQKLDSFVREIQKPEYLEINYHRKNDLFSSTDSIFLEDVSGKVELIQNKDSFTKNHNVPTLGVANLTTGCTVCVQGYLGHEQKFIVEEIVLCQDLDNYFSDVQSHHKNPTKMITEHAAPKGNLLFVSTLKATKEKSVDAKFENLATFLTSPTNPVNKKIEMLVAFGGLWGDLDPLHINLCFYYNYAKTFASAESGLNETCHYLEGFFRHFLSFSGLDTPRQVLIAPSLNDPTFSSLPQLPFRKVLFGKLTDDPAVKLLANPDVFQVNGQFKFLLMDGLNVWDFCSQTGLGFDEAIKGMLLMRLLAPTCPNTLESLPCENQESLILKHFPDFVMVGNAPEFKEESLLSKDGTLLTKVVFVPDFSKTGKVVVFDPQTEKFSVIKFGKKIKAH